MNVKNNRRRRESVHRMGAAFIALLQTREMREISVTDICKESGVNRSTFYANFEDVYDLADQLKTALEDEVTALYEVDSIDEAGWSDYLRLFRHMKENRLFYLTYFKLGYDDRHSIKLYDAARAEEDFNNEHIEYHLAFFQSGFNAIAKKWLQGGCKESPEEMDQIIRSEYQGRKSNMI